MALKAGIFVNHTVALEWGAGKVVVVTPTMATIEFSDGISRKIAASHFHILQPAEAATFSPHAGIEQQKPGKKQPVNQDTQKKEIVAIRNTLLDKPTALHNDADLSCAENPRVSYCSQQNLLKTC